VLKREIRQKVEPANRNAGYLIDRAGKDLYHEANRRFDRVNYFPPAAHVRVLKYGTLGHLPQSSWSILFLNWLCNLLKLQKKNARTMTK